MPAQRAGDCRVETHALLGKVRTKAHALLCAKRTELVVIRSAERSLAVAYKVESSHGRYFGRGASEAQSPARPFPGRRIGKRQCGPYCPPALPRPSEVHQAQAHAQHRASRLKFSKESPQPLNNWV